MPIIVSYRKYIDPLITRELNLPTGDNHQRIGTELATVDGITYVSLPDGVTLPDDQPPEISDSIHTDVPTQQVISAISAVSPHTKLIRQRVQEMIAEQYSISDEIKLLRTAPSPEHAAYNDYCEECRQWGRDQKSALGL